MGDPYTLGPWLHFSLHCRRTHRYRPSQLFPGHCPTRHLLRSCPLPLRPLNGGRICHYGSLRTLIPPFLRIYPSQHLNKNPLWGNVCRSQSNLLPPTLPWPRRNTSSILRLPRRICTMKHSLFHWILNLTCRCYYVPIYSMRSIRC